MINSLKTLLKKVLDLLIKISNKWSGQLILIALPILAIFVFVNLSGEVFTQADVLNYVYPTLYYFSIGLHNGFDIFWDSGTLSGFPAFISSGHLFSPLSLIFFKFLNFLTAYHWLLALNLILAGFFIVRLLKEMGVSSLAAVVAGLAYIISLEASQGVDLPLVSAASMLPLIFLLLLLDFKKRRWWIILLGGLAIGFSCLAVHYNWLIIVLTGGFIFSLGLNWIYQRLGWRHYLIGMGRYCIMCAIGGAIGLIQFFPVMVFTQLSSRWGGMLYSQSIAESINFVDLISFIFPSFNLPFLTSFPFLYFGILPLVFLISSFFIKSRMVRFFICVFIGCFLLGIEYSPLFWALQKIPVFGYFRVPSRWMFLGFFAASAAAGFGANTFLSGANKKAHKIILRIIGWLIVVISLLSILMNIIYYFFGEKILGLLKEYFLTNVYPKTTHLPIDHYYKIIDNLFYQVANLFSINNFKFVLPVAALVISYLILKYFIDRGSRIKYFLPVVVMAVGLNFIITFPFNTPILSTIDRSVFDYHPQTAEFVSKNPGRVLPFMAGFTKYHKLIVPYDPNQEEMFVFEAEIMTPKMNNFYGVKSVDGFDSMMTEKYAEIISRLGSDRAVAGKKLIYLDLSLEDKIKLFHKRHNLLDMLGARYVISAYNLENNDLPKVFITTTTRYDIPLYVYENKNYLPLVFLAQKVNYLEVGHKDNLDIILNGDNNFNKSTFIECNDCKNIKSSDGNVEVVEYKNGYLRLKVDAPVESWLIFNEQNVPGWEAAIDGYDSNIYTANYLFQAVLVPVGEHEITFNFSYGNIISSVFK